MKVHLLLPILVSTFILSACSHEYNTVRSEYERSPLNISSKKNTDNLLAREVYAATDRVMSQGATTGLNAPILVGTLNNVDFLETASTFGRVVQDQVMTRLAQRGYNVTELKLRNSLNIKQGIANEAEAGEFMLSRDIESLRPQHKASALVTGTYAVAGQEIMVNLKLIDVATGKITGATDFSVTLDRNTRRLIHNSGSKGMSFYGESMAYK